MSHSSLDRIFDPLQRPEVHFDRVMAQNDARIATPALQREALEHIHRMLDARENLYQLANMTLDTSELTPEQSIQQLAVQLPELIALA